MPSLGSTILQLLAFTSVWTPPIQAQDHDPNRTDSTSTVSSCDARTINYITHTLPQFCLTSSWASATSPTANATADGVTTSNAPASSTETKSEPSTADPKDDAQDAAGEGPAKPFMSFEDWKEMMLRETGQDPQDLRSRNANPRRADDRIPPDMGHAGLGEEDEISLNFDSYLDNAGEQKERGHGGDVDNTGDKGAGQAVVYEDGRPAHKSKDAGKTCKERFSYSSFDAGATVLKTSPGAKNAKAILVENKDSYMLLECSAARKFVIVELSDDVLIDTVVLANFEFFSSMIRRFRVSVSDRYPVKADRWKEIGTFEARNSRSIQPFLVENPQIWAKYVRIEFLTQYGNEYYCPLSLIRIHGSRMLDSWKDTDPGRDDESHQEDGNEEPQQLPSAKEEMKPQEIEEPQQSTQPVSIEAMPSCEATLSTHLFLVPSSCPAAHNATADTTSHQDTNSVGATSATTQNVSTEDRDRSGTSTSHARRSEQTVTEEVTSSSSSSVSPSATPAISPTSPSSISPSSANISNTSESQSPSSKPASTSSSTATSVAKPSPANTVTTKNRTTATSSSAPPASPTVQEGFFKAISKRLHQVESNLTLSLKYVEDQARHMSDTLYRTEQKQISKATLFLDNLNQTVLAELRSVREQYDQIWQSTVIALESQREQSNREIVALSTRLNLLADEVVFQKRMAIVQAVLLLSCLLLVIFSRGVSLPYLAPFMDQANLASYDTPVSTPSRHRVPYRTAYDVDTDEAALLAARQRAGYIPVSSVASDDSSIGVRRRTSSVHDSQNAQLDCDQLSPPPTPGHVDGYTSSSDPSLAPHDSQLSVLRRSPAMHQGNSRKPLPALPENPSSP
ncbi:hypothetical protein FZEAL_6895 [Fusarium zealandicum]|uniref:SUN domain-containing protein n=1 Tax=Fusarium zealandicum TaxID=1053134 RepID=A0A8H4XJ64_9HYPO|nr:hypothetical protein FZEAL_6895 [Fusarium zealandicum]